MAAAVLVLGAEMLLLFSPRIAREQEPSALVVVVDVGQFMHLTINRDSEEFLECARDPRLLLTDPVHRIWQSRPLYIAAGWMLSLPFRYLLPVTSIRLVSASRPRAIDYLPEYLAFEIINWGLLTITVLLFMTLVDCDTLFTACTCVPITVLLYNEVTKAFFWTPHLQLFNILLPLLTISVASSLVANAGEVSRARYLMIGGMLGLGCLAYGAFVVMIVTVVVLTAMSGDVPWMRRLGSCASITGMSAMPIIGWAVTTVAVAGGFYSHEVEQYRQFVWLRDALGHGLGFLAKISLSKLLEFKRTLVEAGGLPGIMLCGAVSLRYALRGQDDATDAGRFRARALCVYLTVAGMFFGMMGFYRTRLAWSLVAPLLVVLGLELRRIERAILGQKVPHLMFRVGLSLGACSYAAYWISKAGPYS